MVAVSPTIAGLATAFAVALVACQGSVSKPRDTTTVTDDARQDDAPVYTTPAGSAAAASTPPPSEQPVAPDAAPAVATTPTPAPEPAPAPTPAPEPVKQPEPEPAKPEPTLTPDEAKTSGSDTDHFNGSRLSKSWKSLRTHLLDISVKGGELHLIAKRYSVWFNDEVGALLYKNVTGDFVATASVKARKASDTSKYVGPDYQFGGILANSPSGSKHNYVFIVVGDRGGYLSVETKSTTNSRSNVQGPKWPTGDAEVRICRIGSTFRLYKRKPGASKWTAAVSYQRKDLPKTLQVGPFAYAYTGRPDLRASFDYVTIAPAKSAADCTAN